MSLQVTKPITLCSASALDFIKTFCFLHFQDIKFPQISTQYLSLSLGEPAQSQSVSE